MLIDQDSGFSGQMDGILGLGFSGLSDNRPTFIQSLKSAGVIQSAVFSMYLSYDGFNSNISSNLEIGTYNLTKFSSNGAIVLTVPVKSSPGYWESTASYINLGKFIGEKIDVIFDSGTSLIIADIGSYNSIYSSLKQQYNCLTYSGYIICPCADVNQMPSLLITFGQVNLGVPGNRMWEYSSGYCLLMMGSTTDNFWILGDVLLQNYYTIYDMDKLTVSFAPSINSNYTPPLPDYENSPFLVLDAVIALVLFSL